MSNASLIHLMSHLMHDRENVKRFIALGEREKAAVIRHYRLSDAARDAVLFEDPERALSVLRDEILDHFDEWISAPLKWPGDPVVLESITPATVVGPGPHTATLRGLHLGEDLERTIVRIGGQPATLQSMTMSDDGTSRCVVTIDLDTPGRYTVFIGVEDKGTSEMPDAFVLLSADAD